jgi:hypothetical protein
VEERSGNGELVSRRPCGGEERRPCEGEERQWRPRMRCKARTTSTWLVRASFCPQTLNYDFFFIHLTGRVRLPIRAALQGERGGGAPAGAAHHPQRREHHQSSGDAV